MSRGTVEIPIEVWEHCQQDAERMAYLHKECLRLAAENERLRNVIGADAIDREHGMCCDASSQVERLREAAQAVELAFQTLDNGLIETPHWVRQQAMRDAVSQLRAAAKEGGAK